MEISDMQIFMEVAKQGSVSKAAEQLGYVQSNVTARIRSLEKEMGRPLFQRHRRGMTLNPEGRKLLVYAEKMTMLMNEMHKAFQNPDDPAGMLKIGSVETVVGLPDILNLFYRRYANVDISLVTGVTESLTEEVQQLKLDGAFVSGPVDVPNIDQHVVFEEELVLVCSQSREELNAYTKIEELLHLPLLVFRRGCGYRAKLEKWMQSEGVTPLKVMEFGTLETIIGTVVAGLGITLVPRAAVHKLEREGLVTLFSIPELFRQVSVVYIRRSDAYMGEVERRFLETITEVRAKRLAALYE
ncbi:LysR family transcriptional regulator [Paenibacillus sp. SC116]|uniref:LysR family transcriptional regulator n=1 Tax=Paenibacillus sp. SC116 TaxID=2968986 RepID=UPI00215AA449|nr:LysR family transcriptional regulator [Paenibacillus sp. SC116]MCR8843838.1 LysR family transcriptional regulator [Paenibacillus sp. SC116]